VLMRDSDLKEVLRLVGEGGTCIEAAERIGVDRKTIVRWRKSIPGFGAAYDQAVELSRDPDASGELDLLVRSWRTASENDAADAGSVAAVTPPPPKPRPPKPPDPARVASMPVLPRAAKPVVPDVLDSQGNALSVQGERPAASPSPYPTERPPTRDEFNVILTRLIVREKTPERVRAVAIAALNSSLPEGDARRGQVRTPELEQVVAQAAASRGRDAGVPASVWQEARRNFLGPAPDARDGDQGGEVVDLEQATTPG